jgi:hypothetical protein
MELASCHHSCAYNHMVVLNFWKLCAPLYYTKKRLVVSVLLFSMTARIFINYKNIAGNFSRFGHKLYAKQLILSISLRFRVSCEPLYGGD